MATTGSARRTTSSLDASLARARDIGDRYSEAKVLLVRAEARRRSLPPDVDGAMADLDEALALFEEMHARPAIARTLRAQGEVLALVGRTQDAEAKRRRADELFSELGILEAVKG